MDREAIVELGKYLEEERSQRHLTLKEMSERTRLSAKTLRNIEEGNYEQIGAPVLVRSFLRNYCKVLEIDPEPLFERYGPEIFARCENLEKERIQKVASLTQKPRTKRPIFSLLLAAAVVVLVVWLVGVWISKRSAQVNTVPHPLATDNGTHNELQNALSKRDPVAQKSEGQTVVPQDKGKDAPVAPEVVEPQNTPSGIPPDPSRAETVFAGDAEPDTDNTPPSVVQSPPAAGKHRLTIEASRKTWVIVVMDGKHREKSDIEAGSSRSWDMDKNVFVVIGYPGVVRVTWDNQPVKFSIGSARVLRLRLPAEGSEAVVPPHRNYYKPHYPRKNNPQPSVGVQGGAGGATDRGRAPSVGTHGVGSDGDIEED